MNRCPIGDYGDPHYCLGARCQVTGVCDHNRRLNATPVKPITNRLDYHYGNARNMMLSHGLAEEYARMMCDSELNPRHLPTTLGHTGIYSPTPDYQYVVTFSPNGGCLRLWDNYHLLPWKRRLLP